MATGLNRTWVATLEDGTQVLIELWGDTLTVATRERSFDMWGPPVDAVES